MPIPTDTFWNIKRLNVVFALSAVLLVLVTAWAIVQDYGGYWRNPQREARAWDAAVTDDKIQRELTDEEKETAAKLEQQIAQKTTELTSSDKTYQDLLTERKKIESNRATLEFRLNNLKSTVQVSEAQLQDALAAKNETAIKNLNAELEAPRKQRDQWNEELAAMSDQIASLRKRIDASTLEIQTLRAQRTELISAVEPLRKKLELLAPSSAEGKLSSLIRSAPLMGFINPSEKVQQIVLPDVQTDVAFMKITTVDRCTTCHVNIGNKDYSEGNILAFLEEQISTVRGQKLPATPLSGGTAPVTTADKPGPVAFGDFWHLWARKLDKELVRLNNTRLNTILGSISAPPQIVKVVYDKQPFTPANPYSYNHDATDANEIAKQDEILLALLDAFAQWTSGKDSVVTRGKAQVTVPGNATGAPFTARRNTSMRYIEELRNGLKNRQPAEQWELLEDRYRYALVDDLNAARAKKGLPALDASPVMLAHPKLELYVDVDSPHGMEAVGCTSCHDGSGQETDFVLTAHVARDIFVDDRTGEPVLRSQLNDPPAEHHEKNDLSSMLDAAEHAHSLHFESQPATQPAEDDHHGAASTFAYADPATKETGRAMTQFDYWKKIHEPRAPRSFALVYHEWDWPMRTRQLIQTNCARCHTDVYDIKDTAPVLFEGRQLFTQLGCVNCHQMDSIPSYENRKVGTDLRHVTSKLSPEYINTWIWAPKAFRPTTKMPHFFMLENNSSDEEIRRTRQEARAMTEYLVRNATPLPPKHALPQGAGNVEAGKAIFNSIGCLACHQNLNERGQEWITNDLVKREGKTAEVAKTEYDKMSYNERQIYVQQHMSELMTPTTPPKYPDGSTRPQFVQIGPELSGIGSKLTAGRSADQAKAWLYDWLKEPRHYSDYTIMPRLRLSDQQTLDLAEYLLAQKRTTSDSSDKWAAGLTKVDTQKLIELTALQLKSRFSVKTAWAKADEDAELTSLATAALTTPVKTAEQAKTEVAAMDKDTKRLVFLGQKMVAHYGCMSCHTIYGTETVTSPCANLSEWGQKGIDKLDYGYLDHHKLESLPPKSAIPLVNGLNVEAANLGHESIEGKKIAQPTEFAWPHVDHNRQSWITQKLMNSRAYDRGKALLEPTGPESPGSPYDKLKMPTFYLNEDQVHAIVTFVLSNRNRLISERLTLKATNEQAKVIARGRELVERYNCVSCHQVEKNAPQIQQYFSTEDIPTKAPPSLRGEGNKIQHAWLFNFFKNIEPLRPLIFDGIRMPSFPASDAEWTAIIAYFNSISNKESKDLGKRLDLVVKYIDSKRGTTTQPTDPATTEPGDDWWQRPEFANIAQALRDWGLVYGHIKPVDIGIGAVASNEDLRKTHKLLMFKSRFTRQLYASPYPFVDSPRPEISDARFKLGEKFFYELQCLKCHVMGDPKAPGATAQPTAPNLGLAYRRLQERWVRNWVQEPGVIQVGTAMPPFFSGLQDRDSNYVFKLHGQSWPRAMKAERLPEVIESEYGVTVDEQTRLLLDFLYAAGVRNHVGVQPAAPTPAP